jgi:hypothetical protein
MKTLSTVQMWLLAVALLAAIVVYAYTIRSDIKIAPKAGCSSCPHRVNENEKAKLD